MKIGLLKLVNIRNYSPQRARKTLRKLI